MLAAPLFALGALSPALAQFGFSNVTVVDPSGNGDATTIQGAINAIAAGSTRWTVLVNAGVYAEAVTLGATRANIDIVGVDPDAVVIRPSADTNAITIEGVGVRNNAIRNLRIETDDDDSDEGDGIVIRKSGTGADPSGIIIENVYILIEGCTSDAIDVRDPVSPIEVRNVTVRATEFTASAFRGPSASGVRIVGCDFLMHDGDVRIGDDTVILDSTIICDGDFGGARDGVGTCGTPADDVHAVRASGVSNLRIQNSYLQGTLSGLGLLDDVQAVTVLSSRLLGSHYGVEIDCGDDISFEGCRISGDSALGSLSQIPAPQYQGVFIDDDEGCEPGSIRFQACEISGTCRTQTQSAYGVRIEAAPEAASGPVRFIGCAISATAGDDGENAYGIYAAEGGSALVIDGSIRAAQTDTASNSKKAFGVRGAAAEAVVLSGGRVSSLDATERESDQFDLLADAANAVRVAGTRFTKWKGAIGSSERQRSVVQRVVSLPSASDTAVRVANLTASEQLITSGLNQPVGYRVLSAKGNQTGMTQDVFIVGKDFGGFDIADKITLSGTTVVKGNKPFATVLKVIFPAQTAPLQVVSVGTTNILGLHAPIAATGDVLQQGRKTAAATSYTFETIGTVNTTYGTVDVSATLTNNDSFEFTFLSSQ